MTDVQAQLGAWTADEKRALAAQLLAKRLGNTKTVHPQSQVQQQWWYNHLMHPESLSLTVPFPMQIVSRVDVAALRRAFQSMVDRHAVFRTTYTMLAGEPMQEVHTQAEVHFEQVDTSQWTDEQIRKHVNAEHLRQFDLEKGPVLRVTLFTRSETDHILFPVAHHIAFDGLSLGFFLEELRHLYEAETAGRPNPLAPPKAQYTDFGTWQTDTLSGPEGERQRAYWQQQLGGEVPQLALPTDRPRVLNKEFLPRRHEFSLDEALVVRLRKVARAHRTTLYTVLLAAFFVQLHRYTGQDDIVVASPMSGRTRPEFEEVIGVFANIVLMRASLTPGLTFAELLQQMHPTVLSAIENQDYPWAMVVSELRANSGSKRDRFFDVSFNINTLSRLGGFLLHLDPTHKTTTVAGLEVQRFDLDQAEEGTDIFLNLLETERGMVYRFRYNPDLFDRETIVRMQGHIESLLAAIVADPEQEIARLPLMSESERQLLLVEWNATEASFPNDQRIQDLFEAQVAATPDVVALHSSTGPMTFGELNQQANRLAHYLVRIGVEPETRVGVFLPRTTDLVVSVLAVLKAGGTYLPLDPNYPSDRLAFMLRDTRAHIVLTIEALLSHEPDADAQVVFLDRDLLVIEGESTENPLASTTAESAAYVLYTSGSTGLPKGVLGLHRGALNRFAWMWQAYPFMPRETCCLTTTLSFVDAVWELFGPLLKGVPVVLIPDEVVKDFGPLVETLAASNVTRFVLVPSLLDALLENEPDLAKKLPHLKHWTSSGEALSVELVRRFRAILPSVRLINLYGSSELAADVTCCDTTSLDLESLTTIPIGRAIQNTQTYILDELGQPVPIGVSGELYVGGANLARGYLDRPALTAERFIQNPFLDEPGARLFRTGDRARYRADGNIEYVGRVDNQVKIRGSRVEPGEVEAALAKHPTVRDVVVIADRDRRQESRLVAYVVPIEGNTPSSMDLRSFLRERLPEFMVPSVFVMLSALPLTPNGKVNRLALPSPEGTTIEDDFEPPKTPMEIIIAEIWREALEIQQVGRHDNFFDLGGHSLMAMKVNAKLQRRTGVRFNVGIMVTQNLGQVAAIYEAVQRRKEAAQPAAEQPKPGGRLANQMFSAVKRLIGPRSNGPR